jgi:hypothetical protein
MRRIPCSVRTEEQSLGTPLGRESNLVVNGQARRLHLSCTCFPRWRVVDVTRPRAPSQAASRPAPAPDDQLLCALEALRLLPCRLSAIPRHARPAQPGTRPSASRAVQRHRTAPPGPPDEGLSGASPEPILSLYRQTGRHRCHGPPPDTEVSLHVNDDPTPSGAGALRDSAASCSSLRARPTWWAREVLCAGHDPPRAGRARHRRARLLQRGVARPGGRRQHERSDSIHDGRPRGRAGGGRGGSKLSGASGGTEGSRLPGNGSEDSPSASWSR